MPVDAVIAGHICLDIIPRFLSGVLPRPGGLVEVGAPVIATGGAVANTGLALLRLGVQVRLAARIGDDPCGRLVAEVLSALGPELARELRVVAGEATSYSIVMSPPGSDRAFLHCPGANRTFAAADVPDASLAAARVLHVGYPPLMESLYRDDGAELVHLFTRARRHGVATSLDFALPDPASEAALAPWERILARVLPLTDFFLPSLDEMLLLLERPRYLELAARPGRAIAEGARAEEVAALAARLLALGAFAVGLKLGEAGLYLRTGSSARCEAVGARAALARGWADRELWHPCFAPDVLAGTTGAGDAAIAGFLAGVLDGGTAEDAARLACAVGAACVERPDAGSGIPPLGAIRMRLARGWRQLAGTAAPIARLRWSDEAGLWRTP